ncbi:MAG: endonuclease III [Clostridiales bacterium]|nr:endonuclease III [Clostridiales bacterium]
MHGDCQEIIKKLEEMHPDAHCELNHSTPFELLVAVILSAQCSDRRVNQVTEGLFKKYSKPEDFAALSNEELEKEIFSCGFYKNKARSIINASRVLLEKFGGEVPSTVDELVTLPGVGKKTANVVYANAFGGDAIAVDTHVFRVSNRLGIAKAKTPEETERQLNAYFPKEAWSKVHHLLIFHGRYICHSQKPECGVCLLREMCKHYNEINF